MQYRKKRIELALVDAKWKRLIRPLKFEANVSLEVSDFNTDVLNANPVK